MRPLPDIPGPKLEPFGGIDADPPDITFLEMLGSGNDGYCFKVDIGGTHYYLKAFKFGPRIEAYYRSGRGPMAVPKSLNHVRNREKELMPPKILYNQKDRFARECCAYGRLKETPNEALAARCYSYVYLTPEQEAEIVSRWGTDRYGRGRIDWRPWGHWKGSVRALVKELLVDTKIPLVQFDDELHVRSFTQRDVPRMMRDIQTLHSIGIVPGNVWTEEYIEGRYIDFADASTTPYLPWDTKSRTIWLRRACYLLTIWKTRSRWPGTTWSLSIGCSKSGRKASGFPTLTLASSTRTTENGPDASGSCWGEPKGEARGP